MLLEIKYEFQFTSIFTQAKPGNSASNTYTHSNINVYKGVWPTYIRPRPRPSIVQLLLITQLLLKNYCDKLKMLKVICTPLPLGSSNVIYIILNKIKNNIIYIILD